jgi:hypothetical protein
VEAMGLKLPPSITAADLPAARDAERTGDGEAPSVVPTLRSERVDIPTIRKARSTPKAPVSVRS